MMFTEEDAKTKWCPYARTLGWDSPATEHFVGASINREVGNYDSKGRETVALTGRNRCIASECMAWRWASSRVLSDAAPPGLHDLNGPFGKTVRLESGYCGAFGKPEAT